MKNMYSLKSARQLAKAMKRGFPKFNEKKFLADLDKLLRPLELKDRMKLLEARLAENLTGDFKKDSQIIIQSLQQSEDDDLGLSGFIVWPLGEHIALKGLGHFNESMAALKEITKVFTSEFSIRPFLMSHEKAALKLLRDWAEDENHHVRRLVSEGTRPLLPWGERLVRFRDDPTLSFALLEKLVNDPSEYVRKSVANHMNDHSKKHADWTVNSLSAWLGRHPDSKEVAWVIRHASRGLLKSGHSGAMALQGYGDSKSTSLLKFKWKTPPPEKIKFGGKLKFAFEITNTSKKPVKLMIDYAIHFRKANGSLSPKVFKGGVRLVPAGGKCVFETNHSIKPITTRKYYAGEQIIEPRVNGKAYPTKSFKLIL